MKQRTRFILTLDDPPHHLAPLPRGLLPMLREGDLAAWLSPATRTAVFGDRSEVVNALELFGDATYVRLDHLRVLDLSVGLELLLGGVQNE